MFTQNLFTVFVSQTILVVFSFNQTILSLFTSFILFSRKWCLFPKTSRVAIHGEVTLDNKPFEHGEILFSSIAGATPAVSTGSPIKNGTFSLPAKQGLIPEQTYSVHFRSIEVISGTQEETEEIKNQSGIPYKTRNLIPSKYGTKSK
jgi:hypothetical protein